MKAFRRIIGHSFEFWTQLIDDVQIVTRLEFWIIIIEKIKRNKYEQKQKKDKKLPLPLPLHRYTIHTSQWHLVSSLLCLSSFTLSVSLSLWVCVCVSPVSNLSIFLWKREIKTWQYDDSLEANQIHCVLQFIKPIRWIYIYWDDTFFFFFIFFFFEGREGDAFFCLRFFFL